MRETQGIKSQNQKKKKKKRGPMGLKTTGSLPFLDVSARERATITRLTVSHRSVGIAIEDL